MTTGFNSLREGGGQLQLSDTEQLILAGLLVGQLQPDREGQDQPRDPAIPALLHDLLSTFLPLLLTLRSAGEG